jgi:23S rRNA G2445 N2-methylase RlmL
VNRGTAIGFSSGLEHRVARAETFWAYYRGHHPLLDDLFSGSGTLLCEQAVPAAQESSERRWGAAWNGLLRAIGL